MSEAPRIPPAITGQKILQEGHWLRLKQLNCATPAGYRYTWEMVERKQCAYIVVVVAVLNPSREYLLIRQFRPPVNRYVLGLPAGLANKPDIAFEALKELREETGYTGTILQISPPLAFTAALSNEIMHIVTVSIDEHASENKQPVQDLEPEEDIQVIRVPEAGIKEFLVNADASGECIISAALWYLFGAR
ncbi:MAG: NUDIX hydrolase [Candidatus Omnitrophica bacterium]|nr:NUDIX hydrolase [Candidatus Omnitrophota bacterium]